MKKMMFVFILIISIAVMAEHQPYLYTVDELESMMLFIAQNEGLSLTTYTCVAGKQTIGYGSTNPALTSKGTITVEEANAELYSVLCKILIKIDDTWSGLNVNQIGVLADMCYHYGTRAVLANAHDLDAAIISGDPEKIKTQLMRWNKARVGGKLVEVKGLTNRCSRRVDLWFKE